MAYPEDDGDLQYVKELGRIIIPGGGHTLTGIYTQNKVLIWGELKGRHDDTNGIAFTPMGGVGAFGLDTLDFVTFEPKISGTTASPTYQADQSVDEVAYDAGSDDVFIAKAGTNPTTGDTYTLAYVAVGNSSTVVELT